MKNNFHHFRFNYKIMYCRIFSVAYTQKKEQQKNKIEKTEIPCIEEKEWKGVRVGGG